MPKRACGCGGEPEVVGVDLVRRLRCPRCGTEAEEREPAPAAAPASVASGKGGVGLATPPPTPLASLAGYPPAASDPLPLPRQLLGSAGRPWAVEPFAGDDDHATIVSGAGAGSSARFVSSVFGDPDAELQPGARLGGFRIEEVLGAGGMGVVYRARDEALARDVALKVVSSRLCRNPQFIDRFRREARAAAALSHPNITTIYGIGEEHGVHFYSMELVRGRSLIDVLGERGPLPPTQAVQVVRQAAEGLREAARRQIIHRDVKPSNLLLSESGTLKITDFGLAKAFLGAVENTTTGVVMGTPVYMSPEQGTGHAVDHRSDMYSLGVTLYQLVYGKPPFVADSAISLMVKHLQEDPEFPTTGGAPKPPSFVAVVRKMLAKEPARRYETYDALIADLTAFLEGRPVAAAREAPAGDDGVIVLRRRPAAPLKPGKGHSGESSAMLSRSRISIARTNLKMGRADRALSLLREAMREEAEQRIEAALLLVEICESQKDPKGAREALEIVARDGKDPAEVAYASLKLAAAEERAALERDRAALAAYEKLLAAPPPGLAPGPLAARVKALKARIEAGEKALDRTQVVLLDAESAAHPHP